jgi:hypothetical protein
MFSGYRSITLASDLVLHEEIQNLDYFAFAASIEEFI